MEEAHKGYGIHAVDLSGYSVRLPRKAASPTGYVYRVTYLMDSAALVAVG